MDAFATTELSGMQDAAEASMMDTCLLQVWSSGSVDAYGQQVPTWMDSAPLACGFNSKGGREVAGDGTSPIITDASVRLPIGTSVDRKDRVKVTNRFGVALAAAQVFEVVGEPRRGPSGLQLDLRRIAL